MKAKTQFSIFDELTEEAAAPAEPPKNVPVKQTEKAPPKIEQKPPEKNVSVKPKQTEEELPRGVVIDNIIKACLPATVEQVTKAVARAYPQYAEKATVWTRLRRLQFNDYLRCDKGVYRWIDRPPKETYF